MESSFYILRKLDNGEKLHIAWRADIQSAEKLIEDLMERWPAEYEIVVATSRPITCLSYMDNGWLH